MNRDRFVTALRRRMGLVRFGGASLSVILLATPALADCQPDPVGDFATVICSGTDADGLTVTANFVTVNVNGGASVSTVTASPISTPGNPYPFSSLTLNLDGAIGNGLLVQSGTVSGGSTGYPSNAVTAIVGVAGSIGGATAVTLSANPALPGGTATLNLYNAGSIQSASGYAIWSNDPARAAISNFINRNSGTIGGINAPIGSLTNEGTIDGGTGSAIRAVFNGFVVFPSGWQNDGVITAAGAAPTVDVETTGFGTPSIVSTGTIANTGSGDALYLTTGLSSFVNNSGTISAVAGAAIRTNDGLRLYNTGTINGSILGGNAGVTIDNSGGTINGAVTLGSGDDVIVSAFGSAASPLSGFNGAVDVGGGMNTLQLNFLADTTLIGAVATPAGFQTTRFGIGQGATLTFGSGFATNSTLDLRAGGAPGVNVSGSVINQSNLSVAGPVFRQSDYLLSLDFSNTGAIVANLTAPGDFAVDLSQDRSLNNSGSITGNNGGSVRFDVGIAVNTGTITASGTAFRSFDGTLDNSGTITSTQGVGVDLVGNVGLIANNSGTISGATAGVRTSGYTVVNTGTITSPGIGVTTLPYGSVDNRAGGVITGGTTAIGIAPDYGVTFNTTVRNAGTINGNVDLGTGIATNNIFIAMPGGVVNGNVRLGGGGDTFVTSLTNTGSGSFAGVTGTVSGGGGEAIRYLVTSDAIATLDLPAPFTSVGYDLSGGAHLTLTAGTASPATVLFAGAGTVDLTADLSSNSDAPIIDMTRQSLQTSGTPPMAISPALTITSHGTLAKTHDTPFTFAAPIVALQAGDTFINGGSLVVDDTLPSQYSPALTAASGTGGTFINNGTIVARGAATGVNGAIFFGSPLNVTNNGLITSQDAGVVSVGGLTNTGTIATAGAAVLVGNQFTSAGGTVTNSGTLSSSGNAAIRGTGFATVTIENLAGGVITGGQGLPAITLSGGGSVVNAGIINGDVTFANFYTFAASSYVANGGTLNGNLLFGTGNDLFVAYGSGTGVTGTIDAGAGTDTYAQAYTASATVNAAGLAPATFEQIGIGAVGSGTVLTVTGPVTGLDRPVNFFGDGTVINTADVNAGVMLYRGNRVQLGTFNTFAGLTGGLTFVNAATLADGVSGSVKSFTNTGTIGTTALFDNAADLLIAGDSAFAFSNSGIIKNAEFYTAVGITADDGRARSIAIDNSGAIGGSLVANVSATDLTFANSGTVGGSVVAYYNGGNDRVANSSNRVTSVSATNSGQISGDLQLIGDADRLSVDNSGTIAGQLGVGLSHTYLVSDASSVAFSNSGTISSQSTAVDLRLNAAGVTVANSGSITTTAPMPVPSFETFAMGVNNLTQNANSVVVTNTGTISNSVIGGSALHVASGILVVDGDVTPPPAIDVAISVTNGGIVRANGGALQNTFGIDTPIIVPTVALGAFAAATGRGTVAITNAAGGLIEANGNLQDTGSDYRTPTPVSGVAPGLGSLAVAAFGSSVTLINSGVISGGSGGTISGQIAFDGGFAFDSASLFPDKFIAGAIQTFASTDLVRNTSGGVISGSTDLGALDDRFENYGTVNGDVFLRDGNDTFVAGTAAVLSGVADGGSGANALVIDTSGRSVTGFDFAKYVNFGSVTLTGTGSLTLSGVIPFTTLNLDGASLTVAAGTTLAALGPVTITGGAGNERLDNNGTIAGLVDLGGGANTIVNSGALTGGIALDDGSNSVTNSGSIAGAEVRQRRQHRDE